MRERERDDWLVGEREIKGAGEGAEGQFGLRISVKGTRQAEEQ